MSKKDGRSNGRPPPVVIGLNTLTMQSQVVSTGPRKVSAPQRPHKKRVFTEDEWRFLHTRTDEDLYRRIFRGDQLIQMISTPAMAESLGMRPQEANRLISNLKFQQDAIREIIRKRADGPKE